MPQKRKMQQLAIQQRLPFLYSNDMTYDNKQIQIVHVSLPWICNIDSKQ